MNVKCIGQEQQHVKIASKVQLLLKQSTSTFKKLLLVQVLLVF